MPGPVFDVIHELGTPCGGPGLAKTRYFMYFSDKENQKAQKYYFDLFEPKSFLLGCYCHAKGRIKILWKSPLARESGKVNIMSTEEKDLIFMLSSNERFFLK